MATRAGAATCGITASQFRALYEAVAFANCDGIVLNTFITVAWQVAGDIDADANRWCHDRLLENMRTWFHDRNYRFGRKSDFPCVWVRERGKKYGLHSHILVCVPPELTVAFGRWLGSGLVDQSQKMTAAARAMAEKKAVGHRS